MRLVARGLSRGPRTNVLIGSLSASTRVGCHGDGFGKAPMESACGVGPTKERNERGKTSRACFEWGFVVHRKIYTSSTLLSYIEHANV